MEIKKGKVTSNTVEDWAQADEHGNRIYAIKFDDDPGGWFRTKNPEYFTVGEEAYYIKEVRRNKADTKDNIWIKKPTKDQMEEAGLATGASGSAQKSYSGGGGAKWTPKKKVAYKADMVSFGFSYAKDLLIADKLPEGTKLGDMGPMLAKAMWKVLDELTELE